MMVMRLFHGRKDPEEGLDDWGSDGPYLVIAGLHWVYGSIDSIQFKEEPNIETDDVFNVRMRDMTTDRGDLVFYDGVYYGDFEIMECPKNVKPTYYDPFTKGKTLPTMRMRDE